MALVDGVDKVIRIAGRVLLTLFIGWQLFFLLASLFINVEDTVHDHGLPQLKGLEERYPAVVEREGDFHTRLLDFNKRGLRRYAQATGQHQEWSLFAPNICDVLSFSAVEFRWDDDHLQDEKVATHDWEPVSLPGINEPADVNAFWRYRDFRFRKYETNFTPLPIRENGVFDPLTERWRDRIAHRVDDDGDNMLAYLRLRWRDYNNQYKELKLPEPTQVILHMHAYGIPEPPGPDPWRFEVYGSHRIARWLPWKENQSGLRALERYDPLTDRYESVP